MNMRNTYKVSVVCPVYNTASYLKDMMDSVISQDIGFFEHIQVIFIDDGSSDDSYVICKEFERKYSQNVLVVNEKHKGVSYARNKGLSFARGEYVSFLDSDDMLEKSAFSKAYTYIEKNKTEIDIVAMPIIFFGATTGEHILNRKFTSNRNINIKDEYRSILLSASSCLIKRCILGENPFDENLSFAEDAKLVTDLILRKKFYGVVTDTKYFYRRREELSSATQMGNMKKSWYLSYIKTFSLSLLEKMRTYDNKTQSYIKYLVMYDLQWRMANLKFAKKLLSASEYANFINQLRNCLADIDNKIILEQEHLTLARKLLSLKIKYLGGA